jgi:hypothetical protein
LTKIFQRHILVTVSGRSGASMGRHNYIAGGSVPYLVTTSIPIYKVPTGRLKINPYHWKPGKVIVLAGWPFGDDTLSDTIPTPTQESQEQSVVVETVQSKAIADYGEWYDSRRI